MRFTTPGLSFAVVRRWAAVAVLAITGSCEDPLETDLPRVDVPADRNVAWSPDGQWLAFEHSTPARPYPAIHIARTDGSQRRQVVAAGEHPAWSPDGTALLFSDRGNIFRVNLAGDSVVALATEGRSYSPAWSQAGRIAFSSDRGDPEGLTHLWLMNADGGGARQLPVSRPLVNPHWSPGGDRLVSHGGVRLNAALVVMTIFVTDTAGADTAQLTATTADAAFAKWSPAGDWIAYTLLSGAGDIRLIRPDGSGDRLLLTNAFQSAWSPDGMRLAFSRRAADAVAIYAVDADGQNLVQLTSPSGPP
jgi:Tol biopolymer transport system component